MSLAVVAGCAACGVAVLGHAVLRSAVKATFASNLRFFMAQIIFD